MLKPLYKKGSKTDPENIWPISLLPVVSKIIEKIIHNQTMAYLTVHKNFYNTNRDFTKSFPHTHAFRTWQIKYLLMFSFRPFNRNGTYWITKGIWYHIPQNFIKKNIFLLVFQLSPLFGLNVTSEIREFKPISRTSSSMVLTSTVAYPKDLFQSLDFFFWYMLMAYFRHV